MKVILTSTEAKHMIFAYRVPNTNYVCHDIDMPPYTLNQEYNFPNEECFEAFKKQNQPYLVGDHPKLIIGKTTGGKAEKIFKANTAEETKVINDRLATETGSTLDDAGQAGIKLELEVEKNAKETGRTKK
jgi:hypothetical protein